MSGPPTATDLDAWVRATAPRAVAYARSLLRDPHQADDVVQDCYCRLLAKANVYDLPRDGLKLLLRAVSNACINARTRKKETASLTRADDTTDDPADASALPADLYLMRDELADAVAAGLAALPEMQRAAVQLKAIGHTPAEIADVLNVTVTHAGVLLHRGRQALAVHLSPYLGGRPVT